MVNTFLPYGDFKRVASILDYKRLGKQRVEAKQILNILMGKAKSLAWHNHPVVLMWKGHIQALKLYHNIMIDEWVRRGYTNNMKKFNLIKPIVLPWFVHCKPILYSHQASLLRKNPTYYNKLFKVRSEYKDKSYVWISHLTPVILSKLKSGRKIDIALLAREYISK